ncbi:MAG: hypothetical protein RMJ56_06710 [Gemmataceae bacterium]|nr:hypothetical protein [Gemmata sp.]MDW8197280.1 hypothetical protein [Gemmataceae bacterium]
MRWLIGGWLLGAVAMGVKASPPPVLRIPAEVTAAPATITEIRAETTALVVKWVVLTPGLSIRSIDAGRGVLVSGLPGRYELLAYTAVGDVPSEPVRCVVVIRAAPQPPPAPPEPSPPPRPPPTPPPAPPDALYAKLSAAYNADPAPRETKSEHAKDLAALYRAAAKLTDDPGIPTTGELLRRVRDAAGILIGPQALLEIRRIVASELASLLPTDAPLTAAQRQSAAQLFRKLASCLEELAQ